MRFTYRAAGPITAAVILTLISGCSRTQQDWRAAQHAGTPQAYEVFVERHSDSELAGVARQRIAQLTEAGRVATGDASEHRCRVPGLPGEISERLLVAGRPHQDGEQVAGSGAAGRGRGRPAPAARPRRSATRLPPPAPTAVADANQLRGTARRFQQRGQRPRRMAATLLQVPIAALGTHSGRFPRSRCQDGALQARGACRESVRRAPPLPAAPTAFPGLSAVAVSGSRPS